MGAPTKKAKQSLYDRLGGDPFIQLLTCAFFDELVEHDDLKPFFEHISASALKCHQVKLFRVIFGCEADKPADEDVLDFMLRTHTRLFRDLGLDATHFDMVANCFVQGLVSFQTSRALIDECVGIFMPLRVVFEYGAQVASKEKDLSEDQLQCLPFASPKTIGTSIQVVLPEYSKIDIPGWLPEALARCHCTSNVRAWTCDLTDRFGAEGDAVIADTFMDQPYMDHHVYLVAFLELAFMPDDADLLEREKAMKIVLFPRGPKRSKLSRELFDRMIAQFLLTCHKMGMSDFDARSAETKLKQYREMFPEHTKIVGGVNAPHILAKNKAKEAKKNAKRRALKNEQEKNTSNEKHMDTSGKHQREAMISSGFRKYFSIFGMEKDETDGDTSSTGFWSSLDFSSCSFGGTERVRLGKTAEGSAGSEVSSAMEGSTMDASKTSGSRGSRWSITKKVGKFMGTNKKEPKVPKSITT